MPSEMQKVLDELKTTTEELHKYVDRKIEESRASGGEGDPTTRESIDKANAQITELRKLYDELLVASQRPGGLGGGESQDPENLLIRSAFNKWIRHGMGEDAAVSMTSEEKRALANSADADGGFLVPVEFENTVIMNAYNEAAIRPLVGARPTSRDTVFLPALAKPVVSWGAAGVAVSPQDLEVGGQTLQVYDLKALALIHNNTLDDSASDIWGELSDAFSMAVAEAEDNAFAAGAGANSPLGVMSSAGVLANNTVSGVAAALSDASNNGIDVLLTALYNLKSSYRRKAAFGFNSSTEAVIRQLKDSNGQYLWQAPVQAGAPATLLGRPVAAIEGMADIGAGAYPIVVGDFASGYRIRDRSGVTVQRLTERYAEYDQTGFLLKRRTGGQVVKAEAFQCIKIAAS